jgi:hypothetical protein
VTGWINDDSDLTWDLHNITRLGVNAKMGDISWQFEIRNSETGGGTFRMANATWNFGAGSVSVGRMVPVSHNNIDQDIFNARDYGKSSPYGPWADQIMLTFPMSGWNFQVAAVENVGPDTATLVGGDIDKNLPAFEARLRSPSFGPFSFRVYGGYNTYDEVVTATNKEYDIDQVYYGATIGLVFGPFRTEASAFYAQNEYDGNYRFGPTYNAGTDQIVDADRTGWMVNGAYKINDMVSISASYGEISNEDDTVANNEDTASSLAIQLPITLTKGFQIIPGYSQDDYEDRVTNGVVTQEGDRTWIGARWLVRF